MDNYSSIQQTILGLKSFPELVLIKASETYSKLDIKPPRSTHRLQIISYCIHQGYIMLGENTIDPILIGTKLGLSTIDAKSAINNRPKYKKGMKALSPTANMTDIIHTCAFHVLCLQEDIANHMVDTFSKLINVHPQFLNLQVRQMTAAFIFVYLNNNSMSIDLPQLVSTLFLNPSTMSSITATCKKINQIMLENKMI
jgi:hypothetical protein